MRILFTVTITPLLVLFTLLYCKIIGFCITALKFNFKTVDYEVIKLQKERKETNEKLGGGDGVGVIHKLLK